MQHRMEISGIINDRYSCRTYREDPISDVHRGAIEEFISSMEKGPFGSDTRFRYIPAGEDGEERGGRLGTYGFIKNASGFIAGTVVPEGMGLEDYGFQMERFILFAAGLGIGTCWLGGSFTRGSFSARLVPAGGEVIPAVVALGYPAERPRVRDSILRLAAGSDRRKSWQDLFSLGGFGRALDADAAGKGALPLELLRLAPSASNRQPWRVIKQEGRETYHLYLQRTKGYYDNNRGLFGMQDLQRVDMGIGMAHFQAGAAETGLDGHWKIQDPSIAVPSELCRYHVSWIGS